MFDILIKRIYEEADLKDGYRILVDRLWPRGISKKKAGLDEWNKAVAPSTETRKFFKHDSAKMDDFKKKYIAELEQSTDVLRFIRLVAEKLTKSNVTLLYGAKDEKLNNAFVLKNWLEEKLNRQSREDAVT